jgi:citrate/tricarballylate utilization protein
MPSTEILKEAERVMTVCNACRYCEGFCAVFPAMEFRRTFTEQDLKYLANLCHNCRACYYACQYAPPHDFSVNVPKALGEMRLETYREWSWPAPLARLFTRNSLAVTLVTTLTVLIAFSLTLVGKGLSVLFGVYTGELAFYRVISYPTLVLTMSALGSFVIAALFISLVNMWRATGQNLIELCEIRANMQALWDAMRLKYLDGGGHGCNYPDEHFSMLRPWFHHAVFYGFMFCLAATTVAMIYEHFLHRSAPYPLSSLPVVLGTIGGVALLIGSGGLLYLKKKMDKVPAAPKVLSMDIAFLLVLFLTSLTGLLLLVLRETYLMGTLLVLHLGIVAGFFIMMPYGKFIHSIYRYAALVRNALEQARGHK